MFLFHSKPLKDRLPGRHMVGNSKGKAERMKCAAKEKNMPAKANCPMCGKEIHTLYGRKRYNKSGMCKECLIKHNRKEKLDNWLKTGEVGCSVSSTIRGVIREYLYEEQDNKCAICGMKNEWNGKELKFILDHIDGDAANGKRENLRLICPNCDSQLPTYKSKNKQSARKHRN